MLNLDCTLVKVAEEIVEKSSYGIECRCDPDLFQRAMDHFLDSNGQPVCVNYDIISCASNELDCTNSVSEGNFYVLDCTTNFITEL
jgi:hypothetical protein